MIMDAWPFVIASYAIALTGTAALVWSSWSAMRRAESDAENLKGRR